MSTRCPDGFGSMPRACQANRAKVQRASHHHDIGAAINVATVGRLKKPGMRREAIRLEGVTMGQGALEKRADLRVVEIECGLVVLLQRCQFFRRHFCHDMLSSRPSVSQR